VPIIQILLKNGADVNAPCDNWFDAGPTPLHLAAKTYRDYVDSEVILETLVNMGANIHHQAEKGTPLHYAAARGHTRAMKVLINRGADVDSRDKLGSTPLHYAAWFLKPDAVKMLLEMGADVNARKTALAGGETPLLSALLTTKRWNLEDSSKVLQVLIEGGADVGAARKGQTPLSWARRRGFLRVLELLERTIEARGNSVENSRHKGPIRAT
jgi:ankyrin repeat protein